MADPNLALQAIRNSNSKWLGYRYIIYSVPNAGLITGFGTSPLSYSAAGVSEIVFPTITATLRKIPSLSTVDRFIPNHISHSELILKAPTTRGSAFWDRINLQKRALQEDGLYQNIPESIIIGEFEANTIVDLAPIAVWTARGVQATKFTPASANSQGTGAIPLETLSLQIDELIRLI